MKTLEKGLTSDKKVTLKLGIYLLLFMSFQTGLYFLSLLLDLLVFKKVLFCVELLGILFVTNLGIIFMYLKKKTKREVGLC